MKGKKLLALVLCLLMTVSLLPVSALAEGEGEDLTKPEDASVGAMNASADDPADLPTDPENPANNPEDPPTLKGNRDTAEYYLIGSRIDWNQLYLTDDLKFSVNPNNSAEYQLSITLTEREQFKVIKKENGNTTWYPDGEGNNYYVDAGHAGDVVIYFRPDGGGGNDWFYGVIFVYVPQQPTKYTVNVNDINPTAGGTVTVSPSRAAEGETVTLTVTENTGYRIRQNYPTITGQQPWQTVQKQSTEVPLVYTFVMPGYDVYVHTYYDTASTVNVNMYDTTSGHQTPSTACGTVTITPAAAFDGDIVRATITLNPGYKLDPLWTTTWTLVSENGNVVVYDVPVQNGCVDVYFTEHMEEGYYLRLSEEDTDYKDWTHLSNKLIQGDPTFIATNNDVFYYAKTQLTVGQYLQVYHLYYSGNDLQGTDSPVATYTVASDDVVSGQLSTVYLRYAAARSDIGVSAFSGYYLIFHYYYPYEVPAQLKLTQQGGVYVNEDNYFGTDRVRVAHYAEGAIDQLFLDDDYYYVPRESDDSGTYDGPGGFPYGTYGNNNGTGAPGRAYFYPDGSGTNCNIKEGVLHIGRLTAYNIALNASSDECEVSGLPDSAYAGDPVTFTVEVFDRNGRKYRVDQVTATDADNNSIQVTEENGVWSFTMPAADVTVTVTIRERVSHPVALEDEERITGGTVEIETECPNGNSFSYPGDTVTVKLTPEQGYQVGHFSVRRDGSGPEETLPVTGPDEQGRYTFVMPDCMAFIHVTFMVPDGYYLVKIPAGGSIDDVLDVYENGLTAFENDSYVFNLKENLEADDEEYMLTGVTLTEEDMLWVVKVEDGVIKNWDGDSRPEDDDSYMYQVDANHANADTDPMIAIEIYFRPETPDPDQHPGWAAFGDHLFIAIARDIHVTPADSEPFVTFITPSEPKAVYTATVHFRVTPADGYRLLSAPTVTYGDNGSAEVTYDANNDEYTFTMPDCEVNLLVQFCLEDGYYLNGTMNNWDVASITPAMKFQENAGVDGEYKLVNWIFESTDEFKVVKLVNGAIPVDPNDPSYEWYGTSLSGHTGENGNYVINDQAGTKTVYFRPVWSDAWSGHIWIGEEVPAPYFMTEGMNLSTAIEVRFNLIMPGGAEAYPDSYMTFTIQFKDGELFRMDTADAVRTDDDYNGQPRYRFYCPVNAIQMADKITPVFHYKGGNGEWVEVTREPFSAKDYLEKALNDGTGAITDGLRALALATADYGHYAQLYLQTIHSENTYGEHNEMPRYGTGSFDYDATYAAVEACAIVRNPVGDIESIAFSLYCDSTTGIKLYPTMKEGYAQAPTATYNGVTEELVLSEDEPREYVYKMAGVKPSGMAKMRTVKLSDGTKSTKVKVAVLSWVRLTLNNEKPRSDEQKDFACAIYNYNQAALNAK